MGHSHLFTPKCMVVNSRSLVKPGAIQSLQGDLSSQHIDLCFISETWPHQCFDAIESHLSKRFQVTNEE